MLDRLAECEKRIEEDRKELNDLVREFYENNRQTDEYTDYRIRRLKNEIASINQELAIFQKSFHKNDVFNDVKIPEVKYENKNVNEAPPHYISKDIESVVGKNLMGIFASVLIFISLIFFAALIYPYLNNTIKMVVMYGISFMFLGIGLWKIKDDRESKLYQSVTGCGLGAVYISLLLSNIYFEAIGDILLYILIAVWAVFICILSRLNSKIFQIIGQSGICISVIFGVILCVDTEDIGKYLFLLLFFIATSFAFLIAHFKKLYEKNAINNIFNVISSVILLYGVNCLMPNDIYGMYLTAAVVLFAYAAVNLIISYTIFELNKNNNICLCFVNIFYTLIAILLMPIVFSENLCCDILIIILAVLLFAANDIKLKNKKDSGKIIYNVVLLMIIYFMSITTIEIHESVSLVLFIIPLLVLGFIRDDFSYKIYAIIYSVLFMFNGYMEPLLHLILGLSVVGVITGLMIWKRKQYHLGIKNMSYILIHLYIFKDIPAMMNHGETLDFIMFVLHSTINIAAMKTIYSSNWFTKEKEKLIYNTTNIINGICMFVSLFCILNMENEVYHILCIFIAIVLYLINSKNILYKYDNIIPGIYIGMKFTILITAIACSFDASDYAFSIIFFITAITSIVPGFVFRYKSLRIYGLFLAILSIIKLTLFDIVYDNTIERALSFFVCGLLCFVISIIYNRLDKKFLQ